MPEVEDVEVARPPKRVRRLRYRGDLTDAFNARPADQPFGESVTGWPYRVLGVDYAPASGAAVYAVTTVTLEPYPVDAYAAWLERQMRVVIAAKESG